MEGWERLARTMAIGRMTLGALVTLTPGLVLRVYGLPDGANTPAVRYLARLFGVRNAELGFVLWRIREDRNRVRQMATLNACIEGLDAIAGITPLVRRDGIDRAARSALATSITVGTSFLALRFLSGAAER